MTPFYAAKKKKQKAKQNKKRQNRTTVCDNRLIDLELAHTMKSLLIEQFHLKQHDNIYLNKHL